MGEPHRAFGHECRRSQRVGVNAAARSCSRHRIWSCRSECALLCEGAETSTASRLSRCEISHWSRLATRACTASTPLRGWQRGLTGTALNKCESQTRLKAGPPEILGPTLRVGLPSGHPASRRSSTVSAFGRWRSFRRPGVKFSPCRVSCVRQSARDMFFSQEKCTGSAANRGRIAVIGVSAL